MSLFEALSESALGSATARFAGGEVSRALSTAGRLGGDLARGDMLALSRHALATGVVNTLLGDLANPLRQALYWATPTPMFAGLSPSDAKKIHRQSVATHYGMKNLFMLDVSSRLYGDVSESFNLLASAVEYAPSTITGEGRKIGAATVDNVSSAEPVDLTITTLDDASGSIKNWFNAHAHAVTHTDGTLGLPAEYAIRIRIVHHVITSTERAYLDVGQFRTVNMPLSLSRTEDALQELALSFRQLDTFLRV